MSEVLPSIEIALLLGLRHGLAPDHLAAVDGLTVRARPGAAPWTGAIFSLGHGAIMLLIVAAGGLASTWLQPGQSTLELLHMLEWLPGVFLLTLAALNARSLLRPSAPAGAPAAASRPPTPHKTASPLLALGVGMLFALGVESALQAIAWGYAATSLGAPPLAALQVAAVFVLGMTLVDTLDGYVTARIAGVGGSEAIVKFRRRLGWPIVALCVVSGVQLLTAKICVDCEPDEFWMGVVGLCMIGATIAAYALALLVSRHRAPSARPAP